jgi:hypothetical protein
MVKDSTKTAKKSSKGSKPADVKPVAVPVKSETPAQALATNTAGIPIAPLVAAFNPDGRTTWQDYTKKNQMKLNQTGISIETDGDQEEASKSINAHNAAFAVLSTWWQADALYGRQHYNRYGFMHRDGLTRLSDDSLGNLAIEIGEELSQRAAFKGTINSNKKVNPAKASAIIKAICGWLPKRAAAIADKKRAQAYALVESEVGVSMLTPKTEIAG